MDRVKPKVGDILYKLPIGNAVNRHIKPTLSEVTVSKVGHKYFSVTNAYKIETQYYLGTWRENNGEYSARSRLFRTEQEWYDKKERRAVVELVRETFVYHSVQTIPLEELWKIAVIINKYVPLKES